MWNMSVSERSWTPYLFTLLTCGILHMDMTAQQGSRIHGAEQALSLVGRVHCGAVREVGTLLLLSPSVAHFPNSSLCAHVVGPRGAESTLQLNSPVPFPLFKPGDSCACCRGTSFHSPVIHAWGNRMKQVLYTASPISSALLERFIQTEASQNPQTSWKVCLSFFPPIIWLTFCLCHPCLLSYCNPKESAQRKAGCGQ